MCCRLRRGRVVHAHRRAELGAVVGAAGAAAGGGAARGRGVRAARRRRARLLVRRLRPRVQAQVVAAQPPEVGVRQGAAVPVPLLRVPRQAEDAHRAPHGAHAPRAARQARALRRARQRGRLLLAATRPAPGAPCDTDNVTYDLLINLIMHSLRERGSADASMILRRITQSIHTSCRCEFVAVYETVAFIQYVKVTSDFCIGYAFYTFCTAFTVLSSIIPGYYVSECR